MTKRIVVASGNRHKIDELTQLFHACGLADVELVAMTDVVGPLDIDETGTTFAENAYIKASAIAELTGMAVLADDSGLAVDALDGAPGVWSARFAGIGALDLDNRNALRTALSARHVQDSSARFVCVLCYIDGMRTVFAEGVCEGRVGLEDRGESGFGYDPLFTPLGYQQTFGQMSLDQKSALSHRGQATMNLIHQLRALFGMDDVGVVEEPLRIDDLLRASIYVVSERYHDLRVLADRAARTGQLEPLRETILQTYLFAGFPLTLQALRAAFGDNATEHEHVREYVESYDVGSFEQRGERLCKSIYGSVYERMMGQFETLSPSMRQWMIIEGYGKTLSRPGLPVIERELCIVCVLAALERPEQLFSHVRGALSVGASIDDLQRCYDAVVELCGARNGDLLASTIQSVTRRRSSASV